MCKHILLVEDESTLSMIITDTLPAQGFSVATAADGREGLDAFMASGASLVIADVMMPEMDGFEMARRIRRIDPDVPIIFLTAKSAIEDIEEGFDLGGNDYLKKPFRMRELIARIKALLRRGDGFTDAPQTIAIGRYIFSPTSRSLTLGNRTRRLTGLESRLLTMLCEGDARGADYADLMTSLWGRDDVYNRNSLHGFIHRLRRYLKDDPEVEILNMRGTGYRLIYGMSRTTITICDRKEEPGSKLQ